MADTVETAIYKLRVEGQAEIDRLTKSVDGLAVAEEKATTSTRTFSQSLQNQVARIDPLVKAQEQYRKALEANARYRETGVGTETQLNAQLAAATQAYQRQVSAIQAVEKATVGHTNATKLQRHELINLSRQFQDIGVSLFSGQSPLTVLMQQGTQVADVFATSQGTVRGFFGQIAAGAAALITPMNAVIAGAVAATAAAAALALQLDKVQKSSERALLGAGARTGTNITDLNRFVEQNAGIGGTSLSQKEARTLAEDFTKTGDVVISKLRGMSDAVVGFATLTGKSVSDAGKDMVKFATDPLKAMEELNKTYGNFDAATRKAVEALVVAGDKTGAFQVIMDSLSETNKAAAESMGFFEKATRSAVNVLATETGKATGLEAQLENVRAKLNTAIASAPDMLVPAEASDNIAKLSREFETLQAAIEKVNASRVAATNNISAATQETLRAAQLELPVIQAITGATQQAAQYAADYYNALAASKSPADALALAASNLEKSQAAATAAVNKQVAALKDSTEMIKAQQNGTEATTAAAQAYRNAIQSGADATSAAALKAATLANYMAKAAGSAQSLAAAMLSQGYVPKTAAEASYLYDRSGSGSYPPQSQMDYFSSPNVMTGGSFSADPRISVSYRGGGTGKRLDTGAGIALANEMFAAQDKEAADKLAAEEELKNSIDKLAASTDDLNRTNQELLSPYYMQDPRTSHIGFRSQGMAGGGYVDVPGGASANDNMMAMVPVASGERIYVDPMTSRRGGGGAGINISMPMTFTGNVNPDQVGRTVFQTMQGAARQIKAASR